MWRDLRDELHPGGFELVTIALDIGGIDAAGPFIERAQPTHPSLVDDRHALDELFGVVNVPSGIWINEEGMIVRPPEPAWPGRSVVSKIITGEMPPDLDPYLIATLHESRRIRHDYEQYPRALREWVATGAFALSPADVLCRSRPRPPEHSQAAAHFEIGQHLHRAGFEADAIVHFREAHRLQPENWTYKRQAWILVHPFQGPTEHYDGDWVSDVREIGAENYYPPLEM